MLVANGDRMRHFAALAVLLPLLFLLASGCPQAQQEPASPQVAPAATATMPDGTVISLEMASTKEQIIRGLSGREELCAECGMLFVFSEPAPRGFWMRGMRFPLDMVFMDGNYLVVNAAENVPPCAGECLVIHSQGSAKYVLEVNAGFARAHGISTGAAIIVSD